MQVQPPTWALVALGAGIQRANEQREAVLTQVRRLKSEGHGSVAQALEAAVQLSYAADDLAATAVYSLGLIRQRLWRVIALSAGVGALVGGAVGALTVHLLQ